MEGGLTLWHRGLPKETFSTRIFAGELFIIVKAAPVQDLCRQARKLVEAEFGAEPPTQQLAEAAFQPAVQRTRRAIQEDSTIAGAWLEMLDWVGFASNEIYLDRMRLRIVPPKDGVETRFARPLQPHRDTWGSGIMAQINWWLPLYPLSENSTMLVWPDLFERAVENDAAIWNYDQARSGTDKTYPLLPTARALPPGKAMPILIEPDPLLAFSGAHVHASVADALGMTRFGLDTRTVWARDLDAGRAAPDVDGGGQAPRFDMFEKRPDCLRTQAAGETA